MIQGLANTMYEEQKRKMEDVLALEVSYKSLTGKSVFDIKLEDPFTCKHCGVDRYYIKCEYCGCV